MEKHIERETRLNKLPFGVIRKLSYLLDAEDQWQKVVEQISNYDITDIKNFISASKKSEKSPFEIFIYEWGMKRKKVGDLLDKLLKAKLNRAAKYLVEEVLKEEFKEPANQEAFSPAIPAVGNLVLPPKSKSTKPSQQVCPSEQKTNQSGSSEQHLQKNLQRDPSEQYGRLSDNRQPVADGHYYSQLHSQPRSFSDQYSSLGGTEVDVKAVDSQYVDQSQRKVTCLGNMNGERYNTQDKVDTKFNKKEVKAGAEGEFHTDVPNTNANENGETDQDVSGSHRQDTSMGIGSMETVCVREQAKAPSAEEQEDDRAELPDDLHTNAPPYRLPFSMLKSIAQSFNSAPMSEGGNLLGQGGFGSVYYGCLRDGKRLAIKKLDKAGHNVDKQFETELRVLHRFQHENLLPLFGYSCDGPSSCIVYEYMSNGSLEDCLACKNGRAPLSVSERLEITKGTARGINHLHTFAETPLIHRDIKSANVLLDDNMIAKVGDFGIARFGPQAGATSVMTTTVVGTSAYLAPEAIREFTVSVKLDTFSYGVVVLEILTGLPPLDSDREESDLSSYMMEECEEEEDVVQFLDKSVDGWSHDMACQLYAIAMRCLETKKKYRPTMAEILPDIEKLRL